MIRRWEKKDLAAIAEIEAECFSDAWSENMLLSSFSQHGFTGFVYEEDGRVVGYVGASYVFETADILLVAVKEAYRRRGIAESLIRALFSAVADLGITRILLEVRKSNFPAKECYNKLGFVEIAQRARYYADGEDAVIMEKSL